MIDKAADEARHDPICKGCGGAKDSGDGACIVCWNCWRHPKLPYKYFSGSFSQWLKELSALKK